MTDNEFISASKRRPFLRAVTAATMVGLAGCEHDRGENDPATQQQEGEQNGGDKRSFTIHAVEMPIVFNKSGLHEPQGKMYVLDEHLDSVRAMRKIFRNNPPEQWFDAVRSANPSNFKGGVRLDTDLIQPLTIRANVGQTVEIAFHNDLDRNASIHNMGLPQDPKKSDGMNVGHNPDTTVAPGQSETYTWIAKHQGSHMFYDGANQGYKSPQKPPEKANLQSQGLFGSIIVEPESAYWTDPETGKPLRSGTHADVHDPTFTGTSYREFVPYYHTPEGIYNKNGNKNVWPHNQDLQQTVHAINYRAEPTADRASHGTDPADLITLFYSTFGKNGDPGGGDNVFHAYKGDPIKFVAVSASTEENHVHHVHNSRWKQVPRRSDSDTIDAQTLGFGTSYTEYLVAAHGQEQDTAVIDEQKTVRPNMNWKEAFRRGGAGYYHGGAGDILFHCHLFPHYVEGMWAFMRVHDKERPGLMPLQTADPDLVDGTTIIKNFSQSQLPLRDGILPASSNIPGFPDFVPGNRDLFPPLRVDADRAKRSKRSYPSLEGQTPIQDLPDITAAEKKAGMSLTPEGAPYQDPVPDNVNAPVREHTVYCVEGKDIGDTVYNDNGDYDDNALVYVHEDDFKAVMNGDMNVEPLFIRANVGEVVNITIKNRTQYPLSIHPHFMAFDSMGTDSTPSIGQNYFQGILPGEDQTNRWFLDEEGPIYFHDHVVGGEEAMHGTFAGMIVEPEGSVHRDPYSGREINSGAQAIIQVQEGTDYREFCLHYSDYNPLKKPGTDEFVRQQQEHNVNIGTTAINLRNAPYYHRDNEDAAYVHSSKLHGDPATPLLEAYSNDPIKIRFFQGAYEDQHNFTLHGRQLEPRGLNPQDTVTKIISPSEAFTLYVDPEDASTTQNFERMPNPDDLPVRDYMYGSDIVDDRFTGMWGIHRVFDAEVPHLEPLPDRTPPGGQVTESELAEMGHSAPYLGITRLKTLGQRARLIWEDGANRERPPDWAARTQNPNVGDLPPKATDPGKPCGTVKPDRRYEVEAIQTDIEFNDHGDHDPHGIVFALAYHVEDIQEGRRDPDPLTLRATRGDCIEVTLTNSLPAGGLDDTHPDPPMRIPREWDSSERVSLHPQRLTHDVNGSDGATVGFNYDQTIAPGESITYRWYADELYENIVLTDFGDLRGHRHHGAFGNIIIEPKYAPWLDPRTAEPLPEGLESMIKRTQAPDQPDQPDRPDQREFNLNVSDGRYIINENEDFCIVEGNQHDGTTPCTQIGTFEDSGFGSINNSSEPFIHRFQNNPAQHLVYDSDTHGDPATPILRAQKEDDIKMLVAEMADKARGVSFHLSGHEWERYEDVNESPIIGTDDRFSPSKGMKLPLTAAAGGHQEATGDYIYQETKQVRRLESGMWGILRVRTPTDFDVPVQPLPENVGGTPAEERPGWNVVRDDVTDDGTEDLIVGVPVSDLGASSGGAVYVFRNPEVDPTDLSAADLALLGEEPSVGAGASVAVGESNDGHLQLVIGYSERESRNVPAGPELAAVIEDRPDTVLKNRLANLTQNKFNAVFSVRAAANNFTVESENEPPSVEIDYSPTEPAPRETVTFDAAANDPDGEVVEYEWRVDGEPVGENDDALAYAFPEPGDYIVGVTVTDDDGATTTVERTVTVVNVDTSLDNSQFKRLSQTIESCAECGQESAVDSEEGQWNILDRTVEEALAMLECESCGTEQTLTRH